MTHDPFFRSIVIIVNRVIVFVSAAVFDSALLWDLVCRRWLGLSHVDALKTANAVWTGTAYPILTALFKLTVAFAVALTTIIAGALYLLWRRRAEISEGHVRGPRIRGDV
jgi:hypothetical protein